MATLAVGKGNEIIVSAQPKGIFHEGPISGTPKPGTIMQIDVSEGIDDNGNFTWEIFNADADGARPKGPLAVLLPDNYRGKIATDAYADGDHGFLYTPVAGEELNCLMKDVTGTGDDHAIGEMLIVDDTTGKLVATTGTPETEPFMNLETSVDPTADALHHVIYTGY